MAPYYWCAAADQPAPGATVLAWNPDVTGKRGNVPLIAHHFAGAGKVFFVGTDSTWLWRQNVGDRFFYRFWGQVIRFVARRDEANRDVSAIEIRPVRVQPGEPAQIELLAFGPDGAPRTERRLPVSVISGKNVRRVELAADGTRRGRFSGSFTPDSPGEYRVAFEPGDATAPVDAKIRVTAATEELRYPNVNRATLELLASASGGALVELPDVAAVPAKLKGETKFLAVHREASIWDNWLTLVLLVVIYSLDVGLRRLRGLA
jgi:hypothetical protein